MPRRSKKKRSSEETDEPRASRSRRRTSDAGNEEEEEVDESLGRQQPPEEEEQEQQPQQRSVASHVRERQRAIAEREAARLARPEERPTATLAHADRKKSAVTSTPFGVVPPTSTMAALKKKATGGSKQQDEAWCGPFSVARQMIAEREEAKRLEEEQEAEQERQQHPLDEAMKELEQERKRKQHPSILWRSSVSSAKDDAANNGDDTNNKPNKLPSLYATRKRRAATLTGSAMGGQKIPSLYDLCISFLVDNFEHVESVGFVDAAIRKRLAHELVSRHTLDDAALQALAVPGMEALELGDASGITGTAMTDRLKTLVPAGLRYLALDQAGRCFGPKTVQLLVGDEKNDSDGSGSSSNPAPSTLQALAIGGAYLLTDEDAAKLVTRFRSTLESVEYKACPLVGDLFCKSLLDRGKHSLVLRELSLEDLSLSETAWSSLTAAATSSTFWRDRLESLRMRRLPGMTDETTQVLLSTPRSLTALDLSHNYDLSDAILAAIREAPSCGALTELRLAGLKLLTAGGLEALFTVLVVPAPDDSNNNNEGPVMGQQPPRLRYLDLGQVYHQAVTDDVVKLVAHASSSMTVAAEAATTSDSTSRLASAATPPSMGLVHLNIQGSTAVTDSMLETLVATPCGQTIQELNVSFCTQLTDQGLGYFVDHCGSQLRSLEVWGLAQISEVFLDGHKRVADPSLQIVGAWMKKNSVMTIR